VRHGLQLLQGRHAVADVTAARAPHRQ
jgi:hypothetical protein